MRRTKEQKGITLIALIITIVVLLILAVVAINSIQNDGIMSHAKNTANTYNQAVLNEQQHLDNYLSYLDRVQGELSGGSTSNPEGDSGDDSGSDSTEGTTYAVGQEVTVVKGGVEHGFYVIEDSGETVVLLAKGNIDTETLVQDGEKNAVAFAKASYWGEGTSPYDIEEQETIPDENTAAKAAYDYGVKVDGKGRLMTHSEANTLKDNTNFSEKLYETQFWLGSAYDTSNLWSVGGGSLTWYNFTHSLACGVRPVVEISKTELSK